MGKVSDGVAAGMADSLLKDIGWLTNDNMAVMWIRMEDVQWCIHRDVWDIGNKKNFKKISENAQKKCKHYQESN